MHKICTAIVASTDAPSTEASVQSGVLVVTCPTTGREFSTGILTDTESLVQVQLAHVATKSYCPHCNIEHLWWTRDAKLVGPLPSDKVGAAQKGASLADSLEVLVRTAIEQTEGKARAAFYRADDEESALHHIIGSKASPSTNRNHRRHLSLIQIGWPL